MEGPSWFRRGTAGHSILKGRPHKHYQTGKGHQRGNTMAPAPAGDAFRLLPISKQDVSMSAKGDYRRSRKGGGPWAGGAGSMNQGGTRGCCLAAEGPDRKNKDESWQAPRAVQTGCHDAVQYEAGACYMWHRPASKIQPRTTWARASPTGRMPREEFRGTASCTGPTHLLRTDYTPQWLPCCRSREIGPRNRQRTSFDRVRHLQKTNGTTGSIAAFGRSAIVHMGGWVQGDSAQALVRARCGLTPIRGERAQTSCSGLLDGLCTEPRADDNSSFGGPA